MSVSARSGRRPASPRAKSHPCGGAVVASVGGVAAAALRPLLHLPADQQLIPADLSPRAWVPPVSRPPPGQVTTFAGRRSHRAIRCPAVSKGQAAPKTFESHPITKVHKPVMRVISLLLGPVLVVAWAKFRGELNAWIISQGVVAEVGAYMGTGLVLFAVLLTNVVGNSASAVVMLVCRLLRKLNKGHESWVSETLCKLSGPLSRASQAVLAFITLNMFINAIPDTMAWEVPKLLRFCDVNGDGTLEAEEIEGMFYNISIMQLGCYLVLQLALFLQNVRRPPRTPVPDTARDPLGMYLRGLQKLRNHMRGKSEQVAKQYLILRIVDLVLAGAIWVATMISWVSILGVPLRAVVASLAPLGIGGLAFSLAAKNIMQNVISGGLIFLNRAFVEGDEIHSQGGISGVVTDVGLINTRVMRLDGDPMVVPNSHLVDNAIANVQRRQFWLIDRTIPLYMPSFEQLPAVVAAMDSKLKECIAEVALPGSRIRSISVYEEPVCYFAGFGHQGAEIRVRAYVNGVLNRHKFYEVSSNILLALNRVAFAFEGTGVGFEAHILSGSSQQPSHSHGHGHEDHGHGGHSHGGHEGHAAQHPPVGVDNNRISEVHAREGHERNAAQHPPEEVLVEVEKSNHISEVHAREGAQHPPEGPPEEVLVRVDKRDNHVNDVHAGRASADLGSPESRPIVHASIADMQAQRAHLEKEVARLRMDLRKLSDNDKP